MRQITHAGLNLIKQFEGYSSELYLCPGNYWTIGWGHLVRDPKNERWQNGISRAQAEGLLRDDVADAERAVLRLIDVPLSDGQFDALVSFTFNLGAGALQRSTMRRKINRGEHKAVPDELRRWVWAGGKKLRGLMRRREAEACLYVS